MDYAMVVLNVSTSSLSCHVIVYRKSRVEFIDFINDFLSFTWSFTSWRLCLILCHEMCMCLTVSCLDTWLSIAFRCILHGSNRWLPVFGWCLILCETIVACNIWTGRCTLVVHFDSISLTFLHQIFYGFVACDVVAVSIYWWRLLSWMMWSSLELEVQGDQVECLSEQWLALHEFGF